MNTKRFNSTKTVIELLSMEGGNAWLSFGCFPKQQINDHY